MNDLEYQMTNGWMFYKDGLAYGYVDADRMRYFGLVLYRLDLL